MIDYPNQYAGTTLVHWDTGKPTTRDWVLKLPADHVGKGDRFVRSQATIEPPPNAGYRPSVRGYLATQASCCRDGRRRILLVNKRTRTFAVRVPDAEGAEVSVVD